MAAWFSWLAGWGHYMWHHRLTWQVYSCSRKQFSQYQRLNNRKKAVPYFCPLQVSITERGRLNIWPLMSFQQQVGCLRAFIRKLYWSWWCDLLIKHRNFNHAMQPAYSILLACVLDVWITECCQDEKLVKHFHCRNIDSRTRWTYLCLNVYMFRHLMDRLCNHDVLQKLTRETAEERQSGFVWVPQTHGKM